MPNLAILLAPIVPVPEVLPDEPHRTTPYDQAVHDYDGEGEWPEKSDYPDPFGHQPPRNAALLRLLNYRGIRCKPLKRTRGIGFLAHSAKADAFELGRHRGDELGMLYDIAHAYGGDHLVLWTLGQAVHLWGARSIAPGARPRVLQLSIRIDAPRDVGRSEATAERIVAWLDGSPLAPDADALRRAMRAPSLSVPAWFAAFGAPGAKDVAPPDAGAAWNAFEQVADALLRGDAPDAAARKLVNTFIDDSDAQLPGKPATKRGMTADRVTTAFVALRESLGNPTSARLTACASAAELYDRITSGPAGDRLLHTKRTPLASSLALGRLLPHYPVEVRRDPIFLALASHEAEVWNGHGYVKPFAELAERNAATGFTLAVIPEAHEEGFRDAHGVRADESAARNGWAGEAIVDAGGVNAEIVGSLEQWFARTGADGAIVRAEGDGACRVLRFAGGQATEDAPAHDTALAAAARALDPRGAALALGFPDILEPGELADAPREVANDEEPPSVPRETLAGRLDAGGTTRVASLLDHPWPGHDERISLLVRLATDDEQYATAIARDLRGTTDVGPPPPITRSGSELWVHTRDMEANAVWFARMLGDLPAGSTVAFAHGTSQALLEVTPELAQSRPAEAAPAPAPDWVPPQVVLDVNDHVYATADLARLAWSRDSAKEVAGKLALRYPGKVDGTSITATDAVALYDDALRALGFVRLGDLVATHLFSVAVRAYAHDDGVSTAIVVVLPLRPLIECEIQTRLADGTEVTTSSLDLGAPAKAGASVRRASVGVETLWAMHQDHLREVRGERALEPAPTTLADFARLLEG